MIFISMHLPSPNIPQAGQKLAYNRLKEYSQKYNIHLLSFFNNNEKDFCDDTDFSFCKSIELFSLTNLRRIVNFISNINLPVCLAIRKDYRVFASFHRLLRKLPQACIHIEYEQGAVYLDDKLRRDDTVVFHDVISQSVDRFRSSSANFFKKNYYGLQYYMLTKWEKKIIPKINNKVVLNNKDAVLIKKIANSSDGIKIEYPNVSEIFRSVSRNNPEKGAIIFWGAMNRFENIDAVKWFVQDIFPHVLEKNNSAKLYIVGANPLQDVLKLSSDNVIITGFVDNPVGYFEKAQVAIVPLRYGAGVKLKVIEALAANIDVVSTDVGAEGIIDDSGRLYVKNTPLDFANAIIDIIK